MLHTSNVVLLFCRSGYVYLNWELRKNHDANVIFNFATQVFRHLCANMEVPEWGIVDQCKNWKGAKVKREALPRSKLNTDKEFLFSSSIVFN